MLASRMSLAPQVLLDGELVPAGQAKVSVLAEGFLFGRGVFETIRTQAGRALCLAAHHARLSASGSTLGLDAPPPLDELGLRITRLLAAVRMPAAAVKVVRYRELNRTAELITARTLPYSATDYLRGFAFKPCAEPNPTAASPVIKRSTTWKTSSPANLPARSALTRHSSSHPPDTCLRARAPISSSSWQATPTRPR